jgi:predicted DNA-binding protein
MKTISLKVPEVLDAKLCAVAKDLGKPKSEIMRAALERFLSETPEPESTSFLALANDLIGIVDGPEDLATNHEHLEDYGR